VRHTLLISSPPFVLCLLARRMANGKRQRANGLRPFGQGQAQTSDCRFGILLDVPRDQQQHWLRTHLSYLSVQPFWSSLFLSCPFTLSPV
jgi:hypothetical protein